jgi:hypothetical protein
MFSSSVEAVAVEVAGMFLEQETQETLLDQVVALVAT